MRRKSIIIVSILVVIVVIVIGIGLDIVKASPAVSDAGGVQPVTVAERVLVANVGLRAEFSDALVPVSDLAGMPGLEVGQKKVLTLNWDYVLHSRVSRAGSVATC